MATMPQRWERTTRVPPAKARAWWFDLREDDHGVHEYRDRKGASRRQVLERMPTMVRVEDTFRSWTFPATVRMEGGDLLRYEIGQGAYVTRATLRFAPDGTGTRMIWEGTTEVAGLFGLFASLGKGKIAREFQADMDLHAAHMERSWGEAPW